jgi:hypothetical protein
MKSALGALIAVVAMAVAGLSCIVVANNLPRVVEGGGCDAANTKDWCLDGDILIYCGAGLGVRDSCQRYCYYDQGTTYGQCQVTGSDADDHCLCTN